MKPMTKCILIHEPLHANDAAVFAQSETHLQNLCDCFLAWSSTWRKLSLSYEWSSSILGNDRTSSMWSTSCRNKVFAKHLCDTSWWNALREFCKTLNVEALLIWIETSATMAGHMTRMPEDWWGESYCLHPQKSGRGWMTASPTWLGPILMWKQQSHQRFLRPIRQG